MGITNNAIYYERDERTPVTKLSIIFSGAGEQKETEETAGLANITSKLLFRGTKQFTRDQIEKQFDLLGASVSAAVSETEFIIRISAFSRNVNEVLHLVFRMLREADFPESEIEIIKKQEQSRMRSTLQNNEDVLRYAHRFILFNRKRIGKIGSAASLNNITREKIQKYYQQSVSADTVYVTAVSDLTETTLCEYLNPFLQNRLRNGFTLGPETPYRQSTGREIFIAESTGAPNDRLLWSHQGIEGNDPRRFALSMVLDALGSFEGYLFDELRNKNGWCYGVYAYLFPPTMRKSLIGYYSDPSNSTSQFLIPKLMELIETFQHSSEYLHRLRERKASFKNRYSYQLDINYKLTSRINRDKYGFQILDRNEYFNEIDSVTETMAAETIRQVFDLHNMTMIFYGDSHRISSIISKIDPAIPITVFDKSDLIS
ncbi:MAG: insulinase family protein [Bacteroidota bacterium]